MTIRSPAPTLVLVTVIALGTSACMSGINREVDGSLAQQRLQLHEGALTLHATGNPDAAITPEGVFTISGKTVPTNPAQRMAVQDYRTAVIAYTDAALEITAKQAGPIVRRSLLHVLFGVLTGSGDRAERLIDEDSARLESKVRHLCPQLEQAWSTQQSLSTVLPRFRPYANLTQEEAGQCTG